MGSNSIDGFSIQTRGTACAVLDDHSLVCWVVRAFCFGIHAMCPSMRCMICAYPARWPLLKYNIQNCSMERTNLLIYLSHLVSRFLTTRVATSTDR